MDAAARKELENCGIELQEEGESTVRVEDASWDESPGELVVDGTWEDVVDA